MDDLISRQAAIEGKICIQRSNGVEIYDDYAVPVEYLEQLPPAQLDANLAEVGTDCISRQAAIDYFVINVGFHDEDGYPIEDTDELRKIWTEYFDGISTVQPERIKGWWIPMERKNLFRCSECGAVIYSESEYDRNEFHKFCGRCGADMREVTP